jgi:hypothetical protein
MDNEQYQEFIELTQNIYADRDSYSRGKIIEMLRDKVIEFHQSNTPTVDQEKPEVCYKCEQKHLIEQIMRDDENDGLYDPN